MATAHHPGPWHKGYVPPRAILPADETIARVAAFYEVAREDILGASRERHLTHARWAVAFALDRRGWSLNRIARLLRKDHSTVLHGLKQLPEARKRFEELDAACRAAVGELVR